MNVRRKSIPLTITFFLIMLLLPVNLFSTVLAPTYYTVIITSEAFDGSTNIGTIWTQAHGSVSMPYNVYLQPGETITVIAGTGIYNGKDYEFDHWTKSGGAQISSTTSRSITLSASSDGNLKLWYFKWDFDISVSPSSQPVPQGDSVSYFVEVTAKGWQTSDGDGDPVHIWVVPSNLPPASTNDFIQDFPVSQAYPTLTRPCKIQTSDPDTPADTYEITFTGTVQDTTTSHSKTVDLVVDPGSHLPPDLVVENFWWSPSNPTPGQLVSFTYVEKNQGQGNAGAHRNTLLMDDNDVISQDFVDPLPAGESRERTFTDQWTATEGAHEVYVFLDSNYLVDEEENEDNNVSPVQTIGEKDQVQTGLTVEVNPSSIPPSTSHWMTLSGRLSRTDTGAGMAGIAVQLEWVGGFSSATTDSDGYYSYSTIVGPYTEGSYGISARYPGHETFNTVFLTSSAEDQLFVGKIATSLRVDANPSYFEANTPTLLRINGYLKREDTDVGLEGETVYIYCGWGYEDSATTGTNGYYEIQTTATLNEGGYVITATYDGDAQFASTSSMTIVQTWGNQPPSASKVSPLDGTVNLLRGDTLTFNVALSDVDGNLHHVDWFLDGQNTASNMVFGSSGTDSWTYTFTETGTFEVVATVFDEDLDLDSVSWTMIARVITPIPEITGIYVSSEVNFGDWVTITVDARNDGGTADWMSVALSFPDLTTTSSIEIVDAGAFDLGARPYGVGEEAGYGYGSDRRPLPYYPIVEASENGWDGDVSKRLVLRVKPEKLGTFSFYVKSVACVDEVYSYHDPVTNGGDLKDQQNEWVYEETVNVVQEVKYKDPTTDRSEYGPNDVVLFQFTIVNSGESRVVIDTFLKFRHLSKETLGTSSLEKVDLAVGEEKVIEIGYGPPKGWGDAWPEGEVEWGLVLWESEKQWTYIDDWIGAFSVWDMDEILCLPPYQFAGSSTTSSKDGAIKIVECIAEADPNGNGYAKTFVDTAAWGGGYSLALFTYGDRWTAPISGEHEIHWRLNLFGTSELVCYAPFFGHAATRSEVWIILSVKDVASGLTVLEPRKIPILSIADPESIEIDILGSLSVDLTDAVIDRFIDVPYLGEAVKAIQLASALAKIAYPMNDEVRGPEDICDQIILAGGREYEWSISIYTSSISACLGMAGAWSRSNIYAEVLNVGIRPISGDITPPETTLIEMPTGKITTRDVVFKWTGEDTATTSSELTYEYMLVGYDSDWVETSETSIPYTNLPDGSYIFKVKASDSAGNEDPTPDTTYFNIETSGTIFVAINLDEATWSISGPIAFSGGGKFYYKENAPIGEYTIFFNPVIGYVTPSSQTKTLLSGDKIVYEEDYTKINHELNIQVSGSGITNPSPNVYTYDEGMDVSVDAIPDSNWTLDHWELNGVDVGSSVSIAVTMDSDYTLTAVFASDDAGTPPGTYVEIFWEKSNNYKFDMDLEITDAPESDVKVLFWSHQFGFVNGPGGYIGLQTVGSEKKAIFSIWGAIDGTPGVLIEEDGSVWRCLINYDWKLNNKYRLRICELEKEENEDEWWIGTVYEYATGIETIIGKILLPASRGRLSSYSVTWTEYAGYQSCYVPYTRSVFSNHYAYHAEGDSPPKNLKVNYGISPCPHSDVDYYGDTTYALEAGNSVVRDTPEGFLTLTSENLPPVADANGPYSGKPGIAIDFDGTYSYDPDGDGEIESYVWDFGDGESGNGATPSHTYDDPGNYTVTLSVKDKGLLNDSDTCKVKISETLVPVSNRFEERVQGEKKGHVVDALDDANTIVTLDTTNDVTVTVLRYEDNPHPEDPLPATALPIYVDVEVSDPDAVDWPIYIEMSYTDDEIEGLYESTLGIYYWMDAAWQRCSDTGVNTMSNVVWAYMTSEEASGSPILIAGITSLKPAELVVSDLKIEPRQIELGGTVTISVNVTNVGETPGSYNVTLNIEEDLIISVKEVTLQGGESEIVEFVVIPESEGNYDVDIEGMIGTIYVIPIPVPPLPPYLSNLTVTPTEIELGDNVTISLNIRDMHNQSCTYIVTMKIGELTLLVDVELEPYEFKTVSRTIIPEMIGEYHVWVQGLTGGFTVKAPPKPAEFEFSNLRIFYPGVIPTEVERGQTVTVTVSIEIENVGGLEGGRTVELKVDGEVVDSKGVTLEGGASATVLFELTRGEGTHEVEVEGFTDSFTVNPKPSFWDKIPGFPHESIILGLVAVIIMLWNARAQKVRIRSLH